MKESPEKIAAAFSLGIFIGMSPLLGMHTVLGIAAAWILKLNRLVTLVGVYVTNPWTIVPIYTFGTWLGVKILRKEHIIPVIDWSHLTLKILISDFKPFILPFFVGSTALGIVSAALSYFMIFQAAKRTRE